MYPEYIKEVWGHETLEKENGFATYCIAGPEVYIEDIYVRPAFRKSRLATEMADEIAAIGKANGCMFLTCSTDPKAPGWEYRTQIFLRYGFEVYKTLPNRILFVKGI